MFSVWTPNSKSKKQKAEDEMMQQYRADKDAQESSRHNKYRAEADMEETFNNASKPKQKLLGGRSAESRKNYDFENDSEDEQMEDDINENLDVTMGTLGQIKELAIGTNREITAQNELLASMNKKVSAPEPVLDHSYQLLTASTERCCGRPGKMPRDLVSPQASESLSQNWCPGLFNQA